MRRIVALLMLAAGLALTACASSTDSSEKQLAEESRQMHEQGAMMRRNAQEWDAANQDWRRQQIETYGEGMNIDGSDPDQLESR